MSKCAGKGCNRQAEWRVKWGNHIVDICTVCSYDLIDTFHRVGKKYSISEIMEEKVIFT